MPPKRRGRPPKQPDGPSNQTGEASDSPAGRRSAGRSKGSGKGKGTSTQNAVPDVYRDMLADALPARSDIPERPLKKRRTGLRGDAVSASHSKPTVAPLGIDEDDDDDDNIQFEDVLATHLDQTEGAEGSDFELAPKSLQTAYRDSEDESEESEFDWENVDFDGKPQDSEEPSGDLELTLTSKSIPLPRNNAPKRKVISSADKALRLEIHKMNVLCLLSHLDRRNRWCNDTVTQKTLELLLSNKILTLLRPKAEFSQFRRGESLRMGLDQAATMWRAKFNITERGMRRALWADDERDVQNFQLPSDADSVFGISDFRAAAEKMKGSRDIGTQLFCALLRGAGVDARLVCSLQPLSFTTGGPAMPKSAVSKSKVTTPRSSEEESPIDINGQDSPFIGTSNAPFTARGRLGHPHAAGYNIPDVQSAPVRPPPIKKKLNESPFPVFWVEVLDEAHQKWLPVDPLVTQTIAKPRVFEPPASDRQNSMSYVIAFEEEETARDVTRRYAKAYNAKTRKNRVESTSRGSKWWNKTMSAYYRGWKSDLDQIEDTELAAVEAREPMPKNVIDFKDHPYYALERHLRRNEVLTSTHAIGKVAAGRDPTNPGQKKLENVYRRRDVKIARSSDAWYRLGRELKMGVQPIKTVPARRKLDELNDGEELADTNLYTEDQTELYEAPPVVNGRVPKNSFGNLDIYVPSMVPRGGVHLPYDEASRAARLLGIDYADALTGFEFRGRHGTAVLKGIIVAAEYQEAVEAVIEGYRDEIARLDEERRTISALKLWKRFMVGLRIKERVDMYEVEGEKNDVADAEFLEGQDDDEGMESEEYIDDGAGGFFPE